MHKYPDPELYAVYTNICSVDIESTTLWAAVDCSATASNWQIILVYVLILPKTYVRLAAACGFTRILGELLHVFE